ncbi:MAG: L-aspartate oxidase [Bryobacteraceae bacterium]
MYHGRITSTSERTPQTIEADFLVVGAGVAGLRAAIELSGAGSVLVVAKDSLRESSSEYAQGGIAVALSDDDEVELHEQDTLNAGAGLCDRDAVHTLVEEGPAGIEKLIEWGAEFDREGTKLLFAREGAHSRSRVLHAHGDSTGSEIARTLYRKAASLPDIRFQSFSAITDLLTRDGVVTGAVACDKEAKRQVRIHARAVLLATGGLGCVFKETTNPDVATGDGVATAYRAGAVISDIEFVQFHPTALFVPGAPRFLLSEALRGEGAYLRNAAGERFMSAYHPMAELAPRDVVSRAIVSEMRRTGATHVFLDLTHLDPEFVRNRFPRVYSTCLQHGVDITAVPAPVHPAAHYSMGGVRTDLHGRTNLDRLYAAGEVACTGVHGANRLASNSLLEGVVFGARAGAAMRDSDAASKSGKSSSPAELFPGLNEAQIRDIAWDQCGITRTGEGLREACRTLAAASLAPVVNADREHYELRNIHSVAHLIARSALAREESRGGHYRSDFPETREIFQKHSLVSHGKEVSFG